MKPCIIPTLIALTSLFQLNAQTPEMKKTEKFTIKIRKEVNGKTTLVDTTFTSNADLDKYLKSMSIDFMDNPQTKTAMTLKNTEIKSMDFLLNDSFLAQNIADSNIYIMNDGVDTLRIGSTTFIRKHGQKNDGEPIIFNSSEQTMYIYDDSFPEKVQKFEIATVCIRMNVDVLELDQKDKAVLFPDKQPKKLELNDFTVAPNPSDKKAVISFTGKENAALIKVFDQTGKLITEENIQAENQHFTHTMDVNNLLAGTYYIQVIQGKNTFSKKLLITR